MALNGTGQVGVMGAALYVTVNGRQWSICIRRIDGDPDAAFAPFAGQSVTEADIKTLLSGWQTLNWTHYAAPLAGLRRESRATDGVYRIHLIYADGQAPTPDDVTDEFAEDLA